MLATTGVSGLFLSCAHLKAIFCANYKIGRFELLKKGRDAYPDSAIGELTLFKRVLIANRGEIAIRVARAASALGVESVSVYAPVDAALASYPRHHGIACPSAPPQDASSDPVRAYLDIEALIESRQGQRLRLRASRLWLPVRKCQLSPSDASKRVSPSSDRVLRRSRCSATRPRRAIWPSSLGIPIIPGSPQSLASAEEAHGRRENDRLSGHAESGGGRRRPRYARSRRPPTRWRSAFARCQSEAQAAFGDGSVFRRETGRAAPAHRGSDPRRRAGNIVHLYERDCSVQLRNQKVIEIAPAPGLETAFGDASSKTPSASPAQPAM